MKLAELLAQRKNIAKRLLVIENDVRSNLTSNSEEQRVKRNDLLNNLVVEYRDLLEQQTRLSDRIGRLNSKVKVLGYDLTLTEAVAKREALVKLSNLYGSMIETDRYSRYEKDENSLRTVENETEVRKLRDGFAATARKLDVAIQGTNWSVEIVPADPVGETESERELEQVVQSESTLPEHSEDELLQPVDDENDVDDATEEQPEVTPEVDVKPSRKRSPVAEPVDVDKQALLESLQKAQNTPRDRDPNCPIDGAGSPNGVDIADMAYAVYDVYHSMSKLAEFLSSTNDPRLMKVSTRTMQKFIDRNFHEGEQYTPQV